MSDTDEAAGAGGQQPPIRPGLRRQPVSFLNAAAISVPL